MIEYLLSSTNSDVGIDVFRIDLGSFKSLTRTMLSSGLCNYPRMYCLSFSLNFLYLPLAFLCSDVVTKTAPKYSTYPLKFLIDDVYDGRLKLPPCPPRPW